MSSHYNLWLLSLSVLASCIAVIVTFHFVDRLYISSQQQKRIFLPTFAIVAGSSLWIEHILLSFAFKEHLGETRHILSSMSFLAWSFATFTVLVILNTSSKRQLKFPSALATGVTAGLGALGLYFFDAASIHGIGNVQPDRLGMALATLFTMCINTGLIWLFAWQRKFSGVKAMPLKMFAAVIVTLGVIASHMAFRQAFAHGEIADSSSVTTNLIGIILALSFLSLILIAFIFVLFFEKYGKQLFSFSFFGLNKNHDAHAHGLLDNLTNMPNRRAFQQQLASAATRSDRAGTTFALAYIDLDHFKPINDNYGHHVGDAVLTTVAERLANAVRGCDFVARIGGDEFVAIIEEITTDEDISPIINRIVSSIKEPFLAEGFQIHISCSVGVATYPKDGDIEKLVECADAAMYKAKEGGKNQFKFYDATIESAYDDMMELQRDLCLAIEKHEFYLKFQPKIDAKTLTAVGAEALIRWHHPTKGEILPKIFLPAAERFGLINEISDWVVDECCRTMAYAKQSGIDLNISINLSSHQFRNPHLVSDILKAIQFYGLEASNLTFEIKETFAVKNQAQFKTLLDTFNAAGLRVALDDFGLHPISLAYLQDLNINEIKLDRSFVADINQHKASRAIVDAVIKLAHALDLQVVAEGVENVTQRDALLDLGCDYLQGYLFTRSLAEDELFTLYKHLQKKQQQLDYKASGQHLISDYQQVSRQ